MNTPEEKANELYDKFYDFYPNQDAQFIAEQCALIAVNEILYVLENDVMLCKQSKRDYWENVKKEIEKL
jgi:hypothetical protein